MGMPHHTERTKTILKLRTEDGLTYQAIADMFNVSKQHIQKVVSGYDQAPAEKNEDEYDVWEVAELTGFAREWIRRNCKKGNFPEPTRTVRRDSAYHYWNKDLILRWCKVRLKLLLLSADGYLQRELNPTYYAHYKYGYKRSFNTPKIQKVWVRFKALKSQPFSSMHWVGQLNYNNRLSHKKVMEEFKNPTNLTEKFSLHDYSKYEESKEYLDSLSEGKE